MDGTLHMKLFERKEARIEASGLGKPIEVMIEDDGILITTAPSCN